MEVRLISTGKKKAEIIVVEDTTYGKVYQTRHLLLKENGMWKDTHGNYYSFDGSSFKLR